MRHMRIKIEFSLYDLEKCLVYFTTALKSNEVVLEKLRKHIGLRHYEEDEELLEDVIIENKQAMEMTDIYHNILRSTMSLFGSIIDNNLNQVMKFLAAITIILELPTMISGLVWNERQRGGMPFATKTYGFAAISIFSVDRMLDRVYISEEEDIYYKDYEESHKWFFMCFRAFFSRRLTCACEIEISSATSVCVLPSKNRILIISYSRSGRCSLLLSRQWILPRLSSLFFLSFT